MFTAGEPVPTIGRKQIRIDEEEDANANEKRRIHEDEEEEEAGQKELNRQNGNQESHKKKKGKTEEQKTEGFDEGEEEEEAGGNQLGRKRKLQDDENGDKEEEHRQNAGWGNNVNHQNSEQNESGNQESGGDEERRAAEKRKQPMSCKCELMVREFFDFEQGESSNTHEDETHSDIDDHRDLVILKSMWDFKKFNGDFPHPPSDKLLKYILFSITNFKLLKEYLKMKIMEFESNFKDIIQMDGDNPEMNRPIDRETFHLCKLLWGNHQQRHGPNSLVQQDAMDANQIQEFELFLKNPPVHPLCIVSSAKDYTVQDIKNKVTLKQLDMFRQTCFRMYVDILECSFQEQLHRCLITLEVDQDNPNEFWICANGSILHFTIDEFALITGLRCTGNEDDFQADVNYDNRLLVDYFRGGKNVRKEHRTLFSASMIKGGITMKMLILNWRVVDPKPKFSTIMEIIFRNKGNRWSSRVNYIPLINPVIDNLHKSVEKQSTTSHHEKTHNIQVQSPQSKSTEKDYSSNQKEYALLRKDINNF
ncbi:hypothetical protein KY285_009076 [Solanum tuberosum]|nr:hypothetical protein KY285_009076 [Solanum tuberosum]